MTSRDSTNSGAQVLNRSKTEHVPRLLVDIIKLSAQLIQQAESSNLPITDDSIILQNFFEKMEFLLLFGMKPKNNGLFRRKEHQTEFFSFFRAVCRSSKSLIDGLRYVNDQDQLKTNIGKGRALLRYSLTRQSLGDLIQSCCTAKDIQKQFYSPSGLLIHPAMQHVTDALYALYNINFQLLPPCLSELDVNWPQSNIRTGRAQTLPNPVATPTLPDYNIEEDKVQNWLRKSSGIGSTSVSEREIETAHITNETEKAELEVKQEFMARVITDLEMKNTELETKLQKTEFDTSEVNTKAFQKNLRASSTPHPTTNQRPASPTKKRYLLRSAIGLEFDTMSNLSDSSQMHEESTTKTADQSKSTTSSRDDASSRMIENDIDSVSKNLLDGYHRQLEKADERIISLEAEIRIIREEKKRAEEECQKLRDENYIFRDRLAEIANSHPSPTTSAYLTNEIEALANRVEELTSELVTERNKNSFLEKSLKGPPTANIAIQTDQKMLNLEEVKIENEDLQAEVDQLRNQLVFAEENNARRIREIKTESSNELIRLQDLVHELQSTVTCLESDLNFRTRQCQEIKADVIKLNDENVRLRSNHSMPCSPQRQFGIDEVSNSLPCNLINPELMEQFQYHMRQYEEGRLQMNDDDDEEYGDL